jgi:ketosteroid isomerase-like protein
MPRFTPETAVIALELQQIVAEFAADLDSNDGMNICDFYAADGEFAVGDFSHKGHAAIRKFYADRKERMLPQLKDGIRVAAHTFLNVRVKVESASDAIVHFTNVNYGGEGKPPQLGTISPAMVTACRMDFRREADGEWRITRFSGSPLFVGDDPVTKRMLLKKS